MQAFVDTMHGNRAWCESGESGVEGSGHRYQSIESDNRKHKQRSTGYHRGWRELGYVESKVNSSLVLDDSLNSFIIHISQ